MTMCDAVNLFLIGAAMSFHSYVSIRGRTTVFLVAVLGLGAHWSTPTCQAQPKASWKHLVLFEQDDLVVRLHFQESATLADKDWLRFEFDNRTDQAIVVNSFSYNFDREALDPETGELLVSGGLGRGTARDLFPDESTGSISIPTNGRKSSVHVSNYAAALLGLPPAKGHRVKVDVSARIELSDGRHLEKTYADGLQFQFLWRYPVANEIAAMQARLRQLLGEANNQHATGYLLGAYLKVPDVADSISVKELVASLIPRADLPFSGRDSILRHLNEFHHDAPDLLTYVAKQLRDGNSVFIQSHLHHLPKVWHDDFTDPLVAAFKSHRYSREMILGHLARHALIQDDNQELARRLSDVYFSEGQVKRLQEQQLENPQSLLKSLGMTRDRRLVAVLAPFLQDRRKLETLPVAQRLFLGGPQAAPRICDAAMDAILVILDGKTEHPDLGGDPEKILQQRDGLIKELEERLASLPEFANAAPAPMVPLDEKTLSISNRWKAEQKHEDLFELRTAVKPGLAAEQVRQILGLPIEIERTERGERWLYLKPTFRQGVGDFHWLRLDEQRRAADWEVLPWNEMYKPNLAPPASRLKARKSKRQDDLWDDVFFIDALPDTLTRRGTEVFSISSTGRIQERLGEFERMLDAKIIANRQVGDRKWLLCETPHRFPFAVDLTSGKSVDFAIDGVEILGNHTPSIQSHVMTPFGTAVLMVAGGDRETWPRPGNRPIYFWINLHTGDSRRFPTGWDLVDFSSDQKTAVFSTGAGRRKAAAINVADGKSATMVVNLKETNHVPFDWSNEDPVKPLFNPEDRLVGLSADGTEFPLKISLNHPYIPSTKRLGDRVALHVRGYGSPRSDGNLWIAQLAANTQPQHVFNGAWDYQILDDKRCIFTTPVLDPMRSQMEAFVYDASRNSIWNVLDGVEGLQEGTSRVHFFAGTGEATKSRHMLVSVFCSPTANYRDSWRKWVLLTPGGKRVLIDSMPDEVNEYAQGKFWLRESGDVVLAVGERVTVENRDVTRYRVHHITFE